MGKKKWGKNEEKRAVLFSVSKTVSRELGKKTSHAESGAEFTSWRWRIELINKAPLCKQSRSLSPTRLWADEFGVPWESQCMAKLPI